MKRDVRVLLPWLERREALVALLGFRMPLQNEDITALNTHCDLQYAALKARPAFDAPAPDIEPLPPELESIGQAFMASLAPAMVRDKQIRVGIVDLTNVLSVQKMVAIEAAEKRVESISQNDWSRLMQICLPAATTGERIEGVFDKDGGGLTISSDNPNLRVSPVQQIKRSAFQNDELIGFNVTFGFAHVQVTRYRDRCFLKDGYHRCYGLLARGIRKIPCAYSESQSFADVTDGSTLFISQEHLAGPRPPRVTDFLDPSLSATVQKQTFRKVVRIRAEEFVVNV
jgi:hypothetical protein